jgi:dipicolinate synthase subunit A
MAATDMRWEELTIAVIGGDERDPVIARHAAATGATVRAYGLPWPEGGVPGVSREDSAAEAAEGARYCLFPIPVGVEAEDVLYAPHAPEPIRVDDALLGLLAPGAHIFLGLENPTLRALADRSGVGLHEYNPDQELMFLRAPAIVEGAIAAAIENTDITIHAAEVCVVGFGIVGSVLVRTLIALGARVHVVARNPIQRAGAYAIGATPHTPEELPALAPSLSMIFSAVPARIVGREVLEVLPKGSLVLDIATSPDRADLELAEQLGHRAVWARGLGKRAPITVGASQWMGLRRRIEEIEAEREGSGTTTSEEGALT